MGAGFWANETLDAALQYTNTASKPSDLRITDVRMAGAIIRLDTNQGIVGYGENRDGAIPSYVLELKRQVVGENPCSIDKIFRKIKQFGDHARQGGGVSGIEIALWDLAGKAYNVPIYQMLGGKFRDRIRIYCDTPGAADPKVFKRAHEAPHRGRLHLLQGGCRRQPDPEGSRHAGLSGRGGHLGQHGTHVHRHGDHRQGHRADGRLHGQGARSGGLGGADRHRPLRAHRGELLHPAGQGVREVQPGLDGGLHSVAVHGAVEEDHRRDRDADADGRGHLPEGRLYRAGRRTMPWTCSSPTC